MKIIPENTNDIVEIIASEFRSFGGGVVRSPDNPLSHALRDAPAQFAAGVDIADVVRRVLELNECVSQSKEPIPVLTTAASRRAGGMNGTASGGKF